MHSCPAKHAVARPNERADWLPDAIPPLAAGCCQIWWAPASAAGPQLLDLLDEHEHRRLARLLRGQDRALFLVAHALIRIVAARHVAARAPEIRYARGVPSHGKPRFAGPATGLEFSISHSGGRAVVAVSHAVAVGLDVEQVRTESPEPSLIAAVLGPDEQRELLALPRPVRAGAFCRYWTRKEAVLKATGDGLTVSPEQIAVTAPGDAPALVHWAGSRRPVQPVHLYDLDAAPGYAAALATIGSPLERTEHDGGALLRGRP